MFTIFGKLSGAPSDGNIIFMAEIVIFFKIIFQNTLNCLDGSLPT
jgi:hypothetical protein